MDMNLKGMESAAEEVLRQAEEAEGEYGIPVDPEVADFMGAFEEKALRPEDL